MTTHTTPWHHRLAAGLRAALGLRNPAPADAVYAIDQPQLAQAIGPWCFAWASRAGPHHGNQDCAGARGWPGGGQPQGTSLALAVADGVTLAAEGALAARSLVGYWLAEPPPADETARALWLAAADDHVAQALRACTPEPGAATGAAVWLQSDGSGWATRVGDCRVLIARREPLGPGPGGQGSDPALWAWSVRSQFADQTLGSTHPELFPDPSHPQAEQPAHFVGCQRLGEPQALAFCLQPGDLLMLASDGLHASLSDADWRRALDTHLRPVLDSAAHAPAEHLAAPSPAALQSLCNDLIQTAQQLGSEDDITLLVVTPETLAPGGAP